MYGSNKYGEVRYGENGSSGGGDTDLLMPNLMKYLPFYYQESEGIINIQHAIAKELGRLNFNVEDLRKQYFIDTATWGLAMYEIELGLRVDNTMLYADRREIIKAKLRGRGTTTVKMIKNTAEAFSGGDVDVIEYNSAYYFVVKFIGQKGIPRNLQAFSDMLDTIKPAHLGYKFEFILLTWDMFDHLGMTSNELEENNVLWKDLQEYRINEINEEWEK